MQLFLSVELIRIVLHSTILKLIYTRFFSHVFLPDINTVIICVIDTVLDKYPVPHGCYIVDVDICYSKAPLLALSIMSSQKL